MPLVRSNGRNLYEDPIASTEVEARRSLNDEVGHLGGENDSCLDCRIPSCNAHHDQSYSHLNQPDQSRHNDPDPVLWSMEDKEGEEGPVEKVGEVEDVEVSCPTDEGKSADEDGCEDHQKSQTGGVCDTPYKTQSFGAICEHPIGICPRLNPLRLITHLAMPFFIVGY